MEQISRLNGFLFDLDGTIYASKTILPGAVELLDFLRAKNKKIGFITNNSTLSASEISEKLRAMGIEAEQEQIISPLEIAGEYVKERFGICRVYVVGSQDLQENILKSGHELCADAKSPCEIVLIGRDLNFTYRKMEDSVIHLQKGAKLVSTNLDDFHPIEGGYNVPETGAMVSSIRQVVKAETEIIGKPSTLIFLKALERLELTAELTAMVGDNPNTDIAGGRKTGLFTIWIQNQGWPNINMDADCICRSMLECYQFVMSSFQGVINR